MGFINYPYLILLINDQTFEVTVALEKFWDLNKTVNRIGPFHSLLIPTQTDVVSEIVQGELKVTCTIDQCSTDWTKGTFAKKKVPFYCCDFIYLKT